MQKSDIKDPKVPRGYPLWVWDVAFSLATVLVLTFITGVPWWIRAVAS